MFKFVVPVFNLQELQFWVSSQQPLSGSWFRLVVHRTPSPSQSPAQFCQFCPWPVVSTQILESCRSGSVGFSMLAGSGMVLILNYCNFCDAFSYGFEALSINQWVGVEELSEDGCVLPINRDDVHFTQVDCIRADDIFNQFSFHRNNFLLDIFVMFGCILIFYLIGFVGLLMRVRRSR
jgi:hypothetical protein